MACIVRNCSNETRGKALLCSSEEIRKGTEKGAHTLRATPTREWINAVSKYVGEVKNLNIYVDVTSKVKRKFEKKADPQPAA